MISVALGRASVSGWDAGTLCGGTLSTGVCGFVCVMSSRASRSSASTRRRASSTSASGFWSRTTGNGERTRRFWSVSPPPSRLCWASASGFWGADCDLAFTRTTSRSFLSSTGMGIGGTVNPTPNRMAACTSADRTSAPRILTWRRCRNVPRSTPASFSSRSARRASSRARGPPPARWGRCRARRGNSTNFGCRFNAMRTVYRMSRAAWLYWADASIELAA